MFYIDTAGVPRSLPDAPIFLVVSTKDQDLIVPCFGFTEAAMVQHYLVKVSTVFWTKVLDAKKLASMKINAKLAPGLVLQSATWVSENNIKRVNACVEERSRSYLVNATARRILKPISEKSDGDILKEQLRHGGSDYERIGTAE